MGDEASSARASRSSSAARSWAAASLTVLASAPALRTAAAAIGAVRVSGPLSVECDELLNAGGSVGVPQCGSEQAGDEVDAFRRSVSPPAGGVWPLPRRDLVAGGLQRCPERGAAVCEVAAPAIPGVVWPGHLSPEQGAQVLVHI